MEAVTASICGLFIIAVLQAFWIFYLYRLVEKWRKRCLEEVDKRINQAIQNIETEKKLLKRFEKELERNKDAR